MKPAVDWRAVVRDPRGEARARDEALAELAKDEAHHTPDTCEALQDAIEYEERLRYGAFRALVHVVATGARHPLRLPKLVERAARSPVPLADVERLLRSDRSAQPAAPIVNLAVYRLRTRPAEVDDCVSALRDAFRPQDHRRMLSEAQLRAVLEAAADSSDAGHKRALADVVEKNADAGCDELLALLDTALSEGDTMDRDEIARVQSALDAGVKLAETKIHFLMSRLKGDSLMPHLLKLLLGAQRRQSFSSAAVKSFSKQILAQPERLLEDASSYDILMNCVKSDFVLSEPIVDEVLARARNDVVGHKVFELAALVPKMNEAATSAALDIIFDEDKTTMHRTTAAKCLLASSTKLHKEALIKCEHLCLETWESGEEFELCDVLFRLAVEGGRASEDLVRRYYSNIERAIFSSEDRKNLSKLNEFITDVSVNVRQKVDLVRTLTDVHLFGERAFGSLRAPVDPSVFATFDLDHWRRELLCGALVAGNKDHPSRESLIKIFVTAVNRLESRLLKQQRSIEDVLTRLLIKRDAFALTLENVVDYVIILKEELILAVFLERPVLYETDAEALRRDWLMGLLRKRNVRLGVGDQHRLELLLAYNSAIVEAIMEKIETRSDFDAVVDVLTILENSSASDSSKRRFVRDRLVENSSIVEWKLKLCTYFVRYALEEKSTQSNKDEMNAFNQSERQYEYRLPDIKIIASEIMKNHLNKVKFAIVPNLIDLKRALSFVGDSKSDHLLLLNVADGYHWVLMAILFDAESSSAMALYKDPFGEGGYKSERLRAQRTFELTFPGCEFKHQKSHEQIDEFSSAIFALANLEMTVKKLVENKDEFVANFESFPFANHAVMKQKRKIDFPKLYAANCFINQMRRDFIERHKEELTALKEVLQSKLKGYQFVLEGDAYREPCMIVSIDFPEKDPLKGVPYKYMYSISCKQINFSHSNPIIATIKKALDVKRVYSFNTHTVFVDSEETAIPKCGHLNVRLYSTYVNDDNDKIDEVLDELKVKIIDANRKQMLDVLKRAMRSKMIKYEPNVYERPFRATRTFMDKLITELADGVKRLFRLGWNFDSVVKVISSIEDEEEIRAAKNSFDIVIEYALREYETDNKGQKLIDFFLDKEIKTMERSIHELAVDRTFPGSVENPIATLGESIVRLNDDKKMSILQVQEALCCYEHIIEIYNDRSKSFMYEDVIANWNERAISNWGKYAKENCGAVHQNEKMAVIKRAVEVAQGFSPRHVQMMTLILLVNRQPDKGRLSEVPPGEGKTITVAMLAALRALEGHKVDVVTSSPELAALQSAERAKFYALLGLSVAAFADSIGKAEDVLYGFVKEFQAAALRDVVARARDVAIVDEVDTMLLDDRYHILRLTVPAPGIAGLQTCLAAVWLQIDRVASRVVVLGDRAYYTDDPKVGLGSLGNATADPEKTLVPLHCSKEEFLRRCAETYLRKVIRRDDGDEEDDFAYPRIKIPAHLRRFVTEVQLGKWIESAINAKYKYELKSHYVLRNEKVVPVDAFNAGVDRQSVQWSNGLLQFLQIKHGAKLTPESLASNFISNITFFKQYGANVYGLSGALGDAHARQSLRNTYAVDDVSIPPFKRKQYRELAPVVVDDENIWYDVIVANANRKMRNGRAVLLVARLVSDAEKLAEMFRAGECDEADVKLYKMDEDSSLVKETLERGQIIITTNVSGRGADVEVSDEVERNGGLHVCLTFVPLDARVERRNFGRTSRTGKRGTGQFVLYDAKGRSFESLMKERDAENVVSLARAGREINKVIVKDALFDHFCALLRELESKRATNRKMDAVKERFEIWLKTEETNFESKNFESALEDFKKFSEEILADESSDELYKNPYYHALDGRDKLRKGLPNEAVAHFERAIAADPNFAENAYYGKACAEIARYGEAASAHVYAIEEAVDDFKRARVLMEDRIMEWQYLQSCSSSPAFSEQIAQKTNLLRMQIDAVDCAVGPDLDRLRDRIARFERALAASDDADERRRVAERVFELKETMRVYGDGGVVGRALRSGANLRIELKRPSDGLSRDHLELCRDELDELEAIGFLGECVVSKVRPISPWPAFGSLFSGLVQTIATATVAVLAAGAAAVCAREAMTKGVDDVVSAIKNEIVDGDPWHVRKTVRFVASLECAAIEAVDAELESRGGGTATADARFGSGVAQITKDGWKLLLKKVGHELTKGALERVVAALMRHGAESLVVPKIQQAILECIEAPIKDWLVGNERVLALLRCDERNGNDFFASAIESAALRIVNPRDEDCSPIGILNDVARNVAECKMGGYAAARDAVEALAAIAGVAKFAPNFVAAMDEALGELASDCDRRPEIEADVGGSRANLCDPLASKVAASVSDVVRRKLIAPAAKAAAAYGVAQAWSAADGALAIEIENFKARKRLIFARRRDDRDRVPRPKETEAARRIVEELKAGGETGLVHLNALSDVVGRPIGVLDRSTGALKCVVGRAHRGEPIRVLYSEPTAGHWTPPDEYSTAKKKAGPNDCLFEAVAAQTGDDPAELRRATVRRMESDLAGVADRVVDAERLRSCNRVALCEGGAAYKGSSPDDARRVIDASQGVSGYAHGAAGHPRGHASHPSAATGRPGTDCVENYSRTGFKSAFDSRRDQDVCAHRALLTRDAQRALDSLNRGSTREAVHVPVYELNLPSGLVGSGGAWRDGSRLSAPYSMRSITMVLQHHQGRQNDPGADVHVHTIYPRD